MVKKETSIWDVKYINDVPYMICQNSVPGGKYWRNYTCREWTKVKEDTYSVLCWKCVAEMMGMPEEKSQKKSEFPRGWKFMKEYVHKDGTVFHKGIEQPHLKGTLPPTVIVDKPEKKKLSVKEKEEMKMKLGSLIKELKGKLFTETRKTVRKQITADLKKAHRDLKKIL